MARSASGAITLVDITDGTSPVSAFLTNENHTFSASAGGAVATAERTGFSSQVELFIGTTQGTRIANSTTPASEGQFRVLSVGSDANNNSVATGTGWGFAIGTNAAALITLNSISPTSADTASLSVRVQYHNGINASNFLNLTLTVSKVRQGAGGVVVTMAPTKQYFTADNAGTILSGAPNNVDVQINVDTVGTTGALTIETSQNGGSFTAQTSTSSAAGGIAGFNLDQSTTQMTGNFPSGITTGSDSTFALFIDSANLGANDTLAVRVTAGNGGGDTVTIIKVREGAEGANAIIVVVESSNDTVFRTGEANVDKTLTCRVYDADDGSELTDNAIVYTWSRSGSGSVSAGAVRIGTANRLVQDSGGRVANQNRQNGGQTIVVGDEDIDNREQFTCTVSNVPD